jgi:hypothetical protein
MKKLCAHLEQQERDDRRRTCRDLLREAEASEHGRRTEERREGRENAEDVRLRREQHLARVREVPVAELVREHSLDLRRRGRADERVEDHDVLRLDIEQSMSEGRAIIAYWEEDGKNRRNTEAEEE